jgi:hypothetical protein
MSAAERVHAAVPRSARQTLHQRPGLTSFLHGYCMTFSPRF